MGRARRSRPRRRGGGLRVRAQDRRAGHEPPLRGPAAGAGGHPRRRPGGRGRHGQRRHDRRRPQAVAGRGPGRARGAGRGVHARRRLRGAQPAPGGGRSTAVRQPPQLGRGLVAPEGSRDHGESRAGLLGLPAGRGRRRLGAGQPPPDPGAPGRAGPSGEPGDPGPVVARGGHGLLRALAGAPPRPRLRDRRRRRQGGRPRAAGAAGLHLEGAPLGHRLQVPSGGAHDAAQGHHGVDRADGTGDAVRGAGAGVRRRLHRRRGHAPQRGPGQGQGRPPRRHRDRPEGRRRHPGGRRARPVVATRGRRALGLPDHVPVPARLHAGARRRARPTRGASSRPARSSATSGSSTSARGAPWTSRGWASGP